MKERTLLDVRDILIKYQEGTMSLRRAIHEIDDAIRACVPADRVIDYYDDYEPSDTRDAGYNAALAEVRANLEKYIGGGW